MANLFRAMAAATVVGVVAYFLQPHFFPGAPSPDFKTLQPADAPDLVDTLDRYTWALRDDKVAYRNHCLRVLSFAEHFMREAGQSEASIERRRPLAAVALAYHDIALWSDNKLNYLTPSAARAARDLSEFQPGDVQLVRDIIEAHHKWTPFVGSSDDVLVNAIRLGDWVDFTQNLGLPLRSGMPAGNIAKANAALPKLNFIGILAGLPAKIMPSSPLKGNLEVMKIFKW
ncbi:hypothetical protein CTAYLR_008700 [Chrysophaeum taylorii]|uniref:HD domain-containing protein n=1 Tax=Chrysophaeum taylorii TaxID=2483200 RepID=A0AAD7UJA3_9STRA|nr:hypothetical protein CTAYLR_008700 [Chrysophaeum taylorii]